METGLSEVLVNDIFARNSMELVFDVIWGAIETIAEALFFLEVCCAGRASPRDETRLYIYISLQFVRVSIEFLDEV